MVEAGIHFVLCDGTRHSHTIQWMVNACSFHFRPFISVSYSTSASAFVIHLSHYLRRSSFALTAVPSCSRWLAQSRPKWHSTLGQIEIQTIDRVKTIIQTIKTNQKCAILSIRSENEQKKKVNMIERHKSKLKFIRNFSVVDDGLAPELE